MNAFLEHPHAHQLTYLQHAHRASSLAWRLAKASAALLIHAVCPMWFQTTGTDTIRELHDEIEPRSPPPSPSSPSTAMPIFTPLTHRVPPLATE